MKLKSSIMAVFKFVSNDFPPKGKRNKKVRSIMKI